MAVEQLSEKDAVDTALRLVDLAMKAVQFFVVISVAFGGWVLSTADLSVSAPWSGQRILLAAIYGSSAGGLILGILVLLKKTEIALKLATSFVEDDSQNAVLRRKMYGFGSRYAPISLCATWLLTVALILAYHAP